MEAPVMPKISVIIPVYSAEKHLARCLDSVLSQTFTDFEVVCVDDYSPDASIDILNDYASQDSRVKVIRHTANLGSGGARNTAVNHAAAPYLASVDSDDYMMPHMLETLWNAAENQVIDIVICGFDRVDEAGNVLSTSKPGNTIYFNHNNEIDIFNTTNPAFWNKLWRRELHTINNIYFPNHVYYTDAATMPRIMTFARTIKKIDDELYRYVQHQDSITYTSSYKHLEDHIYVLGMLYDFLQERNLVARYGESFQKNRIGRQLKYHADNVLQSSRMPEDEKSKYLRNILLIRMAFVDYYKYVRDLDSQSIISLLQSASSNLDFQETRLESLPLAKIAEKNENAEIQKRLAYRLLCALIKPRLNEKNKKKLRDDPARFFRDAKHPVLRFCGWILNR